MLSSPNYSLCWPFHCPPGFKCTLVPLALALFSPASLKREGLVCTTILDPGSEGTNEDFLALLVCLIKEK